MTEKHWPFQTGWLSFELEGYRPGHSTYDFYAYDSIPPIPETQFTGKLEWLKASAEHTDQKLDEEEQRKAQTRLQKLLEDAQKLNLSLPEAFLQLMGSPVLQQSIPSCTACYFEAVDKIVPYPGDEGGYIIHFLNDQQGVLTWYLYLTPTGEHCVLVSSIFLDLLDDPEYVEDRDKWTSEAIAKSVCLCAPSFEAFIYRFWLENVLWFKLGWNTNPAPLTEEEERYLSHYKPAPAE